MMVILKPMFPRRKGPIDMVKNFWSDIEFYCINGHDKPVKFVNREGDSPFYACPKYMLMDEKHPDGHEKGEPVCPNRVSFVDATNIVEKFAAIVEESSLAGEVTDFSNFRFKYKLFNVHVLSYSDKMIKIGILNRRAVEL